MDRYKKSLAGLGFSDTAAEIYLALLNKGSCTIAELARLVGKHRPVIYQALPELIAANLVSKASTGKRIVYGAESPAALSVLIKKQTELTETILPDLLAEFHHKDKKPKITFFEGVHGIATAYEQLIAATDKEGNIYRYESPRDYLRNKKYYPSLYWKRAGSKGDVNKYVITNQKTHQFRKNNLNRLSKAVKNPFEHNITQLIGKNMVVFIDYDSETAIMIESSRFANFQKTIFRLLFEKL